MLDCPVESCRGRISNGQRGRQRYWEGDEYTCPKCKTKLVVKVTDDYSDDCIAYLEEKRETAP
jgi:hypothetical protein